MKYLLQISIFFFALLGPQSFALTFDCREPGSPSQGYLILVGDRGTQMQRIESEDLAGPLYRGELRGEDENYLYFIRTELGADFEKGIFEVWIPRPVEENPFFQAEVYYFGTSEAPLLYPRYLGQLYCHIQSEPTPLIYRSEM